jgi:hypothetical protein
VIASSSSGIATGPARAEGSERQQRAACGDEHGATRECGPRLGDDFGSGEHAEHQRGRGQEDRQIRQGGEVEGPAAREQVPQADDREDRPDGVGDEFHAARTLPLPNWKSPDQKDFPRWLTGVWASNTISA